MNAVAVNGARREKKRRRAAAVQDAAAPANAADVAKRLGVRQSSGAFTSRAREGIGMAATALR